MKVRNVFALLLLCAVVQMLSAQTFTVNGVNFHMISVGGGTFQMGGMPGYSNDPHRVDWMPEHEVYLSGFCIGQTEVTQELWDAVMETNSSPSDISDIYDGGVPVVQVSWNDCQTFIAKLNQLTGKAFRLPTEAEWEFAARGGLHSKGYAYSGSGNLDNVAWYNETTKYPYYWIMNVATKAPNELGIYDMSGNVWEWCQDWYDENYYSISPVDSPTGPTSGTYRLLRGGCSSSHYEECYVRTRWYALPTTTNRYYGFRLALDDKYPIEVCGVQLTSANCHDVLDDYEGSYRPDGSLRYERSDQKGRVSYDPETQVLTLDNVELHHNGLYTLRTGPFWRGTINLVGDNSIDCDDYDALMMDGGTITSFDGTGTLHCTGNTSGVTIDGVYSRVTVSNAEVTFEGLQHGLRGYRSGSNMSTLVIDGAEVTMKTTHPTMSYAEASVLNAQLEIESDACRIVSPEGVKFDADKGGYVVNGALTKEPVVVSALRDDYGFTVCGTRVTSQNYRNITGSWLKEGRVSYDPKSATLTLEDVQADCPDDGALDADSYYMGGHGLNINLIGNNKFYNEADPSNSYIILDGNWSKHFTISSTCGGSLTAYSIYIDPLSLTIKDCAVWLDSYIMEDDPAQLVVDNSTLIVGAKSSYSTPFSFEKEPELKGCYIAYPENGYYAKPDKNYGHIYDADGNVAEDCVVILPEGKTLGSLVQGLQICGTDVTVLNAGDLTTIEGVSGDEVSYDILSHTLNLRNSSIVCGNGTCISANGNLDIHLLGDNCWAGIYSLLFEGTILFYGDGSLTMDAFYCAISLYGGILTIKDVSARLTSRGEIVLGGSGYDKCMLIVDNARLEVSGKQGVYHSAINGVDLEMHNGVKIQWPIGGYLYKTPIRYSYHDAIVRDANDNPANWIVISPNDDEAVGVTAVEAETEERGEWYDLQGRMVQNPRQAGVYVSKGRKMVKMKNEE